MASRQGAGSRHIPSTEQYKRGLKKRHSAAKKEKSSNSQYILSFLILFMSLVVSGGREIATVLYLDSNALTITLIAIVVSLMTAHRNILLVVLIVGLSFAVNLPDVVLKDHGINKQILLGTLMLFLLEPIVRRFFFTSRR